MHKQVVYGDGEVRDWNISIRLYAPHELRNLMRALEAGGRVAGDTTELHDFAHSPTCGNLEGDPELDGPSRAPEAVYRIHLDRQSSIKATVTGAFDRVLYLRSECESPRAEAELSCVDDWIDPPEVLTPPHLDPGDYYLFVDGFGSADEAGPYEITLDVRDPYFPPDNDTCETAAPLAPGPAVRGTTRLAEDDYSSTCTRRRGHAAADVVYSFSLNALSRVRLTLDARPPGPAEDRGDPEFDSVLYLRTDCRHDTPPNDHIDVDGDGIGDECDDCTDPDGDSLCTEDAGDNCPAVANADQADLDGDGLGDACDSDQDGDAIADTLDNCVRTPNADQADRDEDGEGDACEGDRDGDGVANEDDNCPVDFNPDQVGSDLGYFSDFLNGPDGVELRTCAYTQRAIRCSGNDDLHMVLPEVELPPRPVAAFAWATMADMRNRTWQIQARPVPDGQGIISEVFSQNGRLELDLSPLAELRAQVSFRTYGHAAGRYEHTVRGAGVAVNGSRGGIPDGGDACDNCRYLTNVGQADGDGEGLGAPCNDDDDGDTVADEQDNCPDKRNPGQEDADGDGVGDACEVCEAPGAGFFSHFGLDDGGLRSDAEEGQAWAWDREVGRESPGSWRARFMDYQPDHDGAAMGLANLYVPGVAIPDGSTAELSWYHRMTGVDCPNGDSGPRAEGWTIEAGDWVKLVTAPEANNDWGYCDDGDWTRVTADLSAVAGSAEPVRVRLRARRSVPKLGAERIWVDDVRIAIDDLAPGEACQAEDEGGADE